MKRKKKAATEELPLDPPEGETPADAADANLSMNGIIQDGEAALASLNESAAAEAVRQDVASYPPVDPPAPPRPLMEILTELQDAKSKAHDDLRYHQAGAKEAKAEIESIETRIDRAIRDARNGAQGTLFADKPAEAAVESADSAPIDPESWRQAPISSLEIPPSTVKHLTEANIETVGALADYTSKGQLVNIKGIGKAAVDKIADASESFHRRFQAGLQGQASAGA